MSLFRRLLFECVVRGSAAVIYDFCKRGGWLVCGSGVIACSVVRLWQAHVKQLSQCVCIELLPWFKDTQLAKLFIDIFLRNRAMCFLQLNETGSCCCESLITRTIRVDIKCGHGICCCGCCVGYTYCRHGKPDDGEKLRNAMCARTGSAPATTLAIRHRRRMHDIQPTTLRC